ncbi:hypothetical protein SAMN05421842_12133 [Clostridium uliginosum]|uniref:Insecticidal crystal toxin domain-containing protein n=2 Tax=Clostridium uliginosum TaxID=119641 RepID=A0A1I1Q7L7_9CLOT|nr:hypothetical protein SAMN05421842_12133 [Clostridium uliginosum]
MSITPITMAKAAYNRDITIPTKQLAVVDGKIKSQINIDKEIKGVNPWLYVDVKLDATKSKQGKFNYAELALKRAFSYFVENKLSLRDGDFSIILNNGFVINKDNFSDKKVTDIAMKEILDKDFYREDTIFKMAFLYHDNAVERTTSWKLIDTIDLPAGSSHTINKRYTAGITKSEELDMGLTLGLKFITESSASAGIDIKYASAKTLAKINTDVNATRSKTFKNSSEIKSSFESTTNIAYNPCNEDKVILRYQLVENYKVDPSAFKDATSKLEKLMNSYGRDIVKIEPTSGESGIDIPVDQIFDVTINK